jgi:hypothetical protein
VKGVPLLHWAEASSRVYFATIDSATAADAAAVAAATANDVMNSSVAVDDVVVEQGGPSLQVHSALQHVALHCIVLTLLL